MDDLVKRLDDYFALGGLFNPELANHQEVSDLLKDCRTRITALEASSRSSFTRGAEAMKAALDIFPRGDLWCGDVISEKGDLTLCFQNADQAEKMLRFFIALYEVLYADDAAIRALPTPEESAPRND